MSMLKPSQPSSLLAGYQAEGQPGPPSVHYQDLGLVDYRQAWDYQEELHRELVARKLDNRQRRKEGREELPQRHYLLFCEHPPVFTLGKGGTEDHLLLDREGLAREGFQFYKINRGGDITYHGPGQIVGYPILDLDEFFTDIHRYICYIEEAVMRTLAEYGLATQRIDGYTGVWLPADDDRPARKICAIGVHLSRWVTMHGFAFNIQTDLSHFNYIVPCGIKDEDKSVTSLSAELGYAVALDEVRQRLRRHFSELFGFEYVL